MERRARISVSALVRTRIMRAQSCEQGLQGAEVEVGFEHVGQPVELLLAGRREGDTGGRPRLVGQGCELGQEGGSETVPLDDAYGTEPEGATAAGGTTHGTSLHGRGGSG